MIIGMGMDVVDIRRIEAVLKKYGTRFVNRIFTQAERNRSQGRVAPASSYAKRFAAKEACAKALGTGFRQQIYWRDIGVVNIPSGQPTLVLTGGAMARATMLLPAGSVLNLHLSLSDDFPYAHAFVMLEAIAGPAFENHPLNLCDPAL